MNFKKEYQKTFADISADEAFKKRLANEMKSEKSPRRKIKPYVGMLATAAALALMVGAVYRTGVTYETKEQDLPVEDSSTTQENSAERETLEIPSGVKADGDLAESLSQTFKPHSDWCKDAETDEEKLDMFLDLVLGGRLEQLYCSDNPGFSEDDIVSDKQLKVLEEKFSKIVVAQDAKEENVTYYKAVCTDEKEIVFQIWDGEYLRINGIDTIYKFEK